MGVTVDGVVLVVCGVVGVVVVVLAVGVAAVVDVAGVVVVTVVGELVVVTVVVGLVFVSLCVEAPKNVVGCPLPVTECPAMRSGTVNSATTIANASRPVRTAARQRGRHASAAVRWGMAGSGPGALSPAGSTRRGGAASQGRTAAEPGTSDPCGHVQRPARHWWDPMAAGWCVGGPQGGAARAEAASRSWRRSVPAGVVARRRAPRPRA